MATIVFKFSFKKALGYDNLSIAVYKGKFDGNLVIFSDLIAKKWPKGGLSSLHP